MRRHLPQSVLRSPIDRRKASLPGTRDAVVLTGICIRLPRRLGLVLDTRDIERGNHE
jgi:hypothetical protein